MNTSTSARRALAGAAATLACACAAPLAAQAASLPYISVADPVTQKASAAQAAKRDCFAAPREGARGVWTQRWIAPGDGGVTVHLTGGRSAGDWDLALFDAVDGKLVASSSAFRANEVAQAMVRSGATILVQACRRSGRASTVPLRTTFVRADLAPLFAVAKQVPALVKVPVASREQFEALERSGLDLTHDVGNGWANVVVYDQGERDLLARLGFGVQTLIGNLDKRFAADRAKERAYTARVGARGSALPTGRTDYRSLEDIQSEMKELAEKNPGLVKVVPIKTKSFQGRDLQAIEIARDIGTDRGRPTFFLNGMHHAREWPSPESIMEFAHELIAGNGKDARITKLLDEVRVVIMPLTNADGYLVSRNAPNPDPDEGGVGAVYSTATGVVIFGGSLGYKRKNCNPVYAPVAAIPCELALGVDPNRNYGESWGGPGASSNPNDQSYRGSGPFSEPEPRAVKEIMSSINATNMLTIHNVAALVLRPPGLKADGFAPDEEALKALGKRMADATGYTNQYGWQLYDTTGTTDDWSYAATAGFGYTIEMGPSGGVFHGNYQESVIDQYEGVGKYKGKGLREAYLVAAEAARVPAYTSRLAGRAPAGRTLRLTKSFKTLSYAVCAIAEPLPVGVPVSGGEDPTSCFSPGSVIEQPEKLEFTTVVPASGKFEWWINPSTRPFQAKAGKRETYVLTCEDGGKAITEQELFVARGETAQLELPCGGVLPPDTTIAGQVATQIGQIRNRLRAINRSRRVTFRLGLRNGTLRTARFQLLKGRRVLGTATLRSVTKSRTVTLKLRRGVRLRAGSYRLRLTATQPKGSPIRVSRVVRVKR